MDKPDFLERMDKEIRRRARHERFHTFDGQIKFGCDVIATGLTLVVVSPCVAVMASGVPRGWKVLAGSVGSGLAVSAYGMWMTTRPLVHDYVDTELSPK